MSLVYHPNEILNTKCEDFDFQNPQADLHELKKEMFEAMKKHLGVGISAPQLGYNFRVFCMLNTSTNNVASRNMLAANPEVVEVLEGGEVEMWEGCLSVPDVLLNISRPYKIKARWTNEHGKKVEEVLVGMTARCFLHELDHLNGIMFYEHVSPIKWKEAQAEAEARKQKANA